MEDHFKQAREEILREDRKCDRLIIGVTAFLVIGIIIVLVLFNKLEKKSKPQPIQTTAAPPMEMYKEFNKSYHFHGR